MTIGQIAIDGLVPAVRSRLRGMIPRKFAMPQRISKPCSFPIC